MPGIEVVLPNVGRRFDNVIEIRDTYTEQALASAQRLVSTYGADAMRDAYIDRFRGLVVVAYDGTTWRFTTPICGYSGTGPHASAQILEMFGFGERHALLQYEISVSDGVELHK